jgi:hypothetical protein
VYGIPRVHHTGQQDNYYIMVRRERGGRGSVLGEERCEEEDVGERDG